MTTLISRASRAPSGTSWFTRGHGWRNTNVRGLYKKIKRLGFSSRFPVGTRRKVLRSTRQTIIIT